MRNTHLFLLGSGPPMPTLLAKSFAHFKEEGPIVLLFSPREGVAIKKYASAYTEPILYYSPYASFSYISIKEHYSEDELNTLKSAGAVMIGGGDTVKYQRNIVDTDLAPIIRDLHRQGVPIAGYSAGALIAPKACAISAKDNAEGVILIKEGLGLIENIVLSAHYLRWQDQSHLRQIVRKLKVEVGYGVDDQSGIYFTEKGLTAIEGYVYMERMSSVREGKG
ncbi:Type 1 glutamine amidotransferase-like domain-containing protein [Halobacillus sp. B23F22_1]|uniref:Type 1 glutamine amidotransferase-like domain-containing protein n=1 Tax=Halobacillus sp. B23F22_1 TaxID=3459514 RepID=UPI00373DF1B8